MRIAVIGATGHIGSYLVPRLVADGHQVLAVSRKRQAPYRQDSAWNAVESVVLDREALEAQNSFGLEIARLEADIIVDLICFTLDSAQQLVSAVAGNIGQLLHCGTIWVYGPSDQVPVTEAHPRRALGEYGRNKAAIESWLLARARDAGLPVTVIHPGHIVGPGWTPLNPAGNFNPQLFRDIAAGREILLPNRGQETLHHVHADDVAQLFVQAIRHSGQANGESFNAVSDQALSLSDYAQGLANELGREARIRYLPLAQWREHATDEDYAATLEHLSHSPNCSNHKAREVLGYRPTYSALESILDSLRAPGAIEDLLEGL